MYALCPLTRKQLHRPDILSMTIKSQETPLTYSTRTMLVMSIDMVFPGGLARCLKNVTFTNSSRAARHLRPSNSDFQDTSHRHGDAETSIRRIGTCWRMEVCRDAPCGSFDSGNSCACTGIFWHPLFLGAVSTPLCNRITNALPERARLLLIAPPAPILERISNDRIH